MALAVLHQKLPSGGAARESLRQKGQFWTPAWAAEAMAAYVLSGQPGHIFDPAVGEGAFFRAAKTVAPDVALLGTEVDEGALESALANQFLTRERAQEIGIPELFLIPAVGRTRDVEEEIISEETLRALKAKGRPTRLFAPDVRSLEEFDPSVQAYLRLGGRRKDCQSDL